LVETTDTVTLSSLVSTRCCVVFVFLCWF